MNNKIHPCLWFEGQAKEAAAFYCSVFDNSKIISDTPMVVTFEIDGQKFMCLNGNANFSFNPSISFFVVCETKDEVDSTWAKLMDGGMEMMPLDSYPWSERYGWLQDRFGLSWQLFLENRPDQGEKFSPTFMFTGDQQGKAEEAMNYFTEIFKDSKVKDIARYTAEDDDVEGTVKHAVFQLGNVDFRAMDSSFAHGFSFNEAVSFVVECKNQEEIDDFWNKLTMEGEEGNCGWLKDRYGISWQIIPEILPKLMSDPKKSDRVLKAFMQMKKFEINKLLEE